MFLLAHCVLLAGSVKCGSRVQPDALELYLVSMQCLSRQLQLCMQAARVGLCDALCLGVGVLSDLLMVDTKPGVVYPYLTVS